MSYAGLEALAGRGGPLPAKASSPLSIIHYPLERNKDYCGLYNSFISKFVVLEPNSLYSTNTHNPSKPTQESLYYVNPF
jgi:hypothetical protein